MKKWIVLLGSLFLVLCWSGAGLADDPTADHDVSIKVDEVAELAIKEGTSVSFVFGAPDTAGDPPKKTTEDGNSDTYLQYTSVVDGSSNKITVKTNSDLPAGATLKVSASKPGENAEGETGTGQSDVEINDTPKDIVTGIETGWTGKAAEDGAKIEYSVDLNADDLVSFTTAEVITVTYTLTTGTQ